MKKKYFWAELKNRISRSSEVERMRESPSLILGELYFFPENNCFCFNATNFF